MMAVIGAVLCVKNATHGQGADAILDLMTRKGMITQREANDVREQLDKDTAQAVQMHETMKVSSWIDEMKWAGDLRLRTEFIDNEDQASTVDRWRFRYRLRFGMTATFSEWAVVGVRLASGSADDPVSTNETFDDAFAYDPLHIELVYVTLQRPDWNWLKVTAGKMNNVIWQPSFNSPLQYDNDVTPEGIAEQITYAFGDKQRHSLFANLHQTAVNEVSGSSDTDAYLLELQAGAEFKFGEDPKKPTLKAKVAAGYMFTLDANSGGLLSDSPNIGNAVGSIAGTTTNFLQNFEVMNVRGEVAWNVSEKPLLGTPAQITCGAEYIQNLQDRYETLAGSPTTGDADQTEGYSGQIAFGGTKKKGEWQVAYQYKHLEADATWDAFTDSDWGTGGTDRKGHVFRGSYNLQEWWQLVGTVFVTEKISNRGGLNSVSAAAGEKLLRLQLDSVVKF